MRVASGRARLRAFLIAMAVMAVLAAPGGAAWTSALPQPREGIWKASGLTQTLLTLRLVGGAYELRWAADAHISLTTTTTCTLPKGSLQLRLHELASGAGWDVTTVGYPDSGSCRQVLSTTQWNGAIISSDGKRVAAPGATYLWVNDLVSSGSGGASRTAAYTATLDGAQAVPHPTGARAGAHGLFVATLSGTTLKWTLTFSGLTGPATAAHIHNGVRGKSGAALVKLCGPCTSTTKGTTTLTAAEVKLLAQAGLYVNVHTSKNPNGEIRGQITAGRSDGASQPSKPGTTTTGTSTSPGGSAVGGSGWNTEAAGLRGKNGQRFTWSCPANGPSNLSATWGTDVYTDDSLVCIAAVHAGVITLAAGGVVVIEIRPGQSSYTGSTRNGITTYSYGATPGSFVVVGKG